MKKFLLTFLFVVISASLALATPPHDLELKYDPIEKSLSITMKHPTNENREHYIRTIVVTVNNDDPKMIRFTFQKLAWGVDTNMPLELKAGDSVHVKASCIRGGSAEADLLIPALETKDKK